MRELQYRTEKHDYENILKSLKADKEKHKKIYKSLNKKKILFTLTEILVGTGSAVGSSTVSLLNPSIGIVLTSSTALLTSIAILLTNEHISNLKIRYTKLRDWNNVITLLYEKTLKTSMVDNEIYQKEAEELKKIYKHYFDKRSEIKKNTSFRVEDVFGDVISKDSISPEQITKFNNLVAKKL